MEAQMFRIDVASPADAEAIHELQQLAFHHLGEWRYEWSTARLLEQSTYEVADDFEHEVFLRATVNGRLAGSVRAHCEHTICHLGWLVVHPVFRRRGIGTALVAAVEARFPTAERFQTFAVTRRTSGFPFFERCGYVRRHEMRTHGPWVFVFMEKIAAHVPHAAPSRPRSFFT